MTNSAPVTVIGGGLAGCEAALTLAARGIPVALYEMRPLTTTAAHHSDLLGELVCSNSLKSTDPNTAAGLLKSELSMLGSQLLGVATEHAVPAGGALAVDRTAFAEAVTARVEDEPLVSLIREEVLSLPETGDVIVATGPLTADTLAAAISDLVGSDHLAFFDAAAPILAADSIDTTVAFPASRYDKGGGADYLNAPMNRSEYDVFITELLGAQRVIAKDFEGGDLFKACQPVEEIARTGTDALRFGPLKPVGLIDPRTGERPWAVVQLRAENRARTAFNLVGFQTNLKWSEQQRVFSLIPGLENAEFLRYGVMHRNTFIDAPRLLDPTLSVRTTPRVRIAGQLGGTEGYTEALASGLLAALNIAAQRQGLSPIVLPEDTALGSLIAYATDPGTKNYQPMHVNFGLVPPLAARVRGKRERYAAYSDRARGSLQAYLDGHPLFGGQSDEQ